MCTVSYFRKNGATIVTSNRDEHVGRPLAQAPAAFRHGGATLYYPVDPQSGGTWFCAKDNGQIFVLLNGADKKHQRQPPYLKSRGIVLLELAAAPNCLAAWHGMELEHIEPFTLIHVGEEGLVQFRWNGTRKSDLRLDAEAAHIWSSATLYTEPTIKARERWFEAFLEAKSDMPNQDDLLAFHTRTQPHDRENGLIINRDQAMLTKNVTQCVVENGAFQLRHFDLLTNQHSLIKSLIHETLVA